jgi:hypothetical protein
MDFISIPKNRTFESRDWKWFFSILTYESGTTPNHISVQDGTAYATDGHRMHALIVFDHQIIKDGVYKVAYTPQEFLLIPVDIKFPDCAAIWPKVEEIKRLTLKGSLSRCFTVFARKTESIFDFKLILDALGINWKTSYIEIEVYLYGKSKPATFLNGNRMALVMPMRGEIE